MALTLYLNGQQRTFPDLTPTATVDRLVIELGLQGDRLAIERNGEIVSRTQWSQAALKEGDRLEIVHFVGGGCPATRTWLECKN